MSAILSPEDEACLNPSPWIILTVQSGQEFDLATDMRRQDHTAYVPQFMFRRPQRGWRNRMIEVIRPLFAGYLFGQVTPRFSCEDFNTSKRMPRRLPGLATDAQVQAVRQIELEANRLPAAIVVRPVEPGDFATIIRGVLKGESAEVLRVKGRNAIINLAKHGRRSIVTVSRADLEAV